ncbi:hypothetical protein AJ78_00323 [Emergomyces pasteurianus Ep9510]|uniref:Uncharacterized protein n=1 Tax=Emergomyces pasteurianus Ep9510 TaxID=1447872 RepID=A0A1J9QV18_9EURO|nr:hypothetical protein AJ78_00323 [Emergomyces pasteurianus Ep9510]
MPDKRKAPSSETSGSPYSKRSRLTLPQDDETVSSPPTPITPATARPQPKSDPVYGQKHAFPGLDDPVDEDQLFYGPAEDGIEYLRMVRSEARTLPPIFVSKTVLPKGDSKRVPEASGQENGGVNTINVEADNSQNGFYSDGVYVACVQRPQTTTPSPDDPGIPDINVPDPQEMYYNLLHHRFLLLRSTLKCTPPASVIASLGVGRPISLPRYNKRARAEWERILQTKDPCMAQLACMDMESVLGLLAIVTRLLSKIVRGRESVHVKRLGAWTWGLLGRCRPVGEMGSEEVGDIRELGKRAAKILLKVRESEALKVMDMLGGGHDMEDGDGGEEEVEESEEEKDEPGYGTGGDINGGGYGDENQVDELNITNTVIDANENLTEHISVHGEDINLPTNGVDAQDELEAARARLQARLLPQQTRDQMEPRKSEMEDVDSNGGDNEENGEVADVGDDESKSVRQYTRAMLDMIISIIGEFYGQRDLLEFRDIWEEDKDFVW